MVCLGKVQISGNRYQDDLLPGDLWQADVWLWLANFCFHKPVMHAKKMLSFSVCIKGRTKSLSNRPLTSEK
jgi:hypothetical protein